MRSHPGGASLFFVLGASRALLHPQSIQPTPQHLKPATKR